MNKIIASLLSVSQIVALCAFFAFAPSVGASSNLDTQNNVSNQAINVITITPQIQDIKLVGQSNKCIAFEVNPQNLVQDQVGVNLNQQSDCFNLSIGKIPVQSELYVQNVNLKSVSIAVKNHEEYSTNSLTNKNHDSQDGGVIIQNQFINYEIKKQLAQVLNYQLIKITPKPLLSNQNIFSLTQVFRC